MGRALICGMHGQTLASGFSWVLGGIFRGATEAQSQASATEQADFTALRGSVQSGGSGTNTFPFRNAGANGNNVASCVGATAFEDATPHTDTVAAGALFNGGYTDTGTDTVSGPIAMNVTLAAGHGNFHFHAAAGATTYAIASATRYFGIHGATTNNGQTAANIAKCQFKNREYTSLEAFQIRITANARLNDSVFSVNINGVDVGTPITFATLTTGLQSVTGMGIALAPGDLVCISLTSGAGVDTLSFSFFGVTLKSTGLSSMGGLGSQNGTTRAASATPLYLSFGNNTNATEANCAVRVGFAARCTNLRVYVAANTYSSDATMKLFVNGVARLTTMITAGAQNQWFENAVDTFDITATDTVSFEIVGGSSGSITTHQLWIRFGLIPDVVATPSPPIGGIGHGKAGRKRRRILLDDGTVWEPATDADFQDYIDGLLRRIAERAQVAEIPAQAAVVARKARVSPKRQRALAALKTPLPDTLPTEFYKSLEMSRNIVLNAQRISDAWAKYQADLEDDEDVTMLLLS